MNGWNYWKFQRRRDNAEIVESTGLDENDKELLDQNKVERDHILVEITELKDRSVRLIFFILSFETATWIEKNYSEHSSYELQELTLIWYQFLLLNHVAVSIV